MSAVAVYTVPTFVLSVNVFFFFFGLIYAAPHVYCNRMWMTTENRMCRKKTTTMPSSNATMRKKRYRRRIFRFMQVFSHMKNLKSHQISTSIQNNKIFTLDCIDKYRKPVSIRKSSIETSIRPLQVTLLALLVRRWWCMYLSFMLTVYKRFCQSKMSHSINANGTICEFLFFCIHSFWLQRCMNEIENNLVFGFGETLRIHIKNSNVRNKNVQFESGEAINVNMWCQLWCRYDGNQWTTRALDVGLQVCRCFFFLIFMSEHFWMSVSGFVRCDDDRWSKCLGSCKIKWMFSCQKHLLHVANVFRWSSL